MSKSQYRPERPANNVSSSSQSNCYAIRIKGFLDPHWDWLENMTVTHLDPGETLLCGPIVDQAALHGLLARIRDLNLTLLAVNQIGSENHRKVE